jgi:hypothetical protein
VDAVEEGRDMSAGREKSRPSGLSCAARRTESRSSCYSSTGAKIRVAKYLEELPPREMLEAKLHEAMRLARGFKSAS